MEHLLFLNFGSDVETVVCNSQMDNKDGICDGIQTGCSYGNEVQVSDGGTNNKKKKREFKLPEIDAKMTDYSKKTVRT